MLLSLAVVPWTVILLRGGVTLVFPFGFVTASGSVSFVSLPELLARGGGLPRASELLPLSVLFYVGALLSAIVAAVDLGDGDLSDTWITAPRFTGGLLALAGLTHLAVSWSVLHRPAYTPLPVGAVCLLVATWWLYWPAVQ